MAPATSTLVVLIIAAVCLGTSDARAPFVAPALRYVSTTKWNTSAALAAGLNLTHMAANDISAVKACIASLPKFTVMQGIAGSAINENIVNCTSVSEWGSYVKVIDFENIAALTMYNNCTAFKSAAYVANTKYVIENHHWISHANNADILLGFPAVPTYLISLNNATAGNNATSLEAVVEAREMIFEGVSSLFAIVKVQPWLPKYSSYITNPMTMMYIIGFNSPQAAIAYKAYKVGNAPGPVPALPEYNIVFHQLATPNKDIEFHPIPLFGNY